MIPRLSAETRGFAMSDGTMWVLGGGRSAPNPNNEVDVYDPGTDTWSLGPAFVTARRNFPAASDGDSIWLVGGYAPTAPVASMEIYSQGAQCATPTPGGPPTDTPVVPTDTPVVPTDTPTSTNTPIGVVTDTPVPSATPTVCEIKFEDVDPADEFYPYITYLFCHDVINGYNTVPPCAQAGRTCFKPGNNTTRGQLAKITVLGFGFAIDTTGGPHFTDVPVGSTFYNYIETGKNLGLFSGYADGTFHPSTWVTRGQISKIVVNAAILADPANWQLLNPGTATFEDVPVGSTFFRHIETAVAHGVLVGYPCGGVGEPCIPPGNRNYFRPSTPATRGQISKVAYLSITYPPARR
jgi:hypothetical protein